MIRVWGSKFFGAGPEFGDSGSGHIRDADRGRYDLGTSSTTAWNQLLKFLSKLHLESSPLWRVMGGHKR